MGMGDFGMRSRSSPERQMIEERLYYGLHPGKQIPCNRYSLGEDALLLQGSRATRGSRGCSALT